MRKEDFAAPAPACGTLVESSPSVTPNPFD